MANLVVTSTANSIKVAANDLAAKVGMSGACWHKESVNFVQVGPYVNVILGTSPSFLVCALDINGGSKVDSVDGVEVTDINQLFSLLCALIE